MSEFRGFLCNGCGAIMNDKQRNKKVVRYDGPSLKGEVHTDLCVPCVQKEQEEIKPEDLKPLRRRGKKEITSDLAAEPVEDPLAQVV